MAGDSESPELSDVVGKQLRHKEGKGLGEGHTRVSGRGRIKEPRAAGVTK